MYFCIHSRKVKFRAQRVVLLSGNLVFEEGYFGYTTILLLSKFSKKMEILSFDYVEVL